MLKSALLATTTFLFIFGWKVTPIADIILFTSVLLIVYSFLRGYAYADRVSIQIIICLGLLSIYSMVIVIAHGVFEVQIALRSIRALINFLAAMSLAGIYYDRFGKSYFARIIRDIYLALVAHACIMLAMFYSTPFRELIYQVTSAHDYVNIASPFLDGLRICGITYGLSQTSVLQMLGLLMLPVVARGCQSFAGLLTAIMGAPLLVLSILISGRSGLMMGLFFIPVYLLGLLLLKASTQSPAKIAGNLLANMLGLFFIGLLVWSSIDFLPEKFSVYSLNHAQEIFLAMRLSGTTVDTLSGMFFLPDSWLELVFGSSNLNNGGFEMVFSDVGWVKTIFAVGLVGSILMIIPYILALKQAWRCRFFSQETAVMSFLVFLSALLLHGKEMALLTRNQWSVQALLLSAICIQLHLLEGNRNPATGQPKSEL
ncbi:MAG: hypothetical protein CVV42_07235 [Candidatus Riflebacteria bacterium HGW-Riflebacteria-2]|nr:MAG: hypothetical protein CVV42_07235 [Candidatus Riflebacteria bacterium HGW-Riflebacteria-2]